MNAVPRPAKAFARPSLIERLRDALADLDTEADAWSQLNMLVARGLDDLPLPGAGATLLRWQALAAVAAHDLSLAKLYEGHTDAIATMAELGASGGRAAHGTWGMWAAEAPAGRTLIEPADDGRVRLRGAKCWCSGAMQVTHGLLTAWPVDGVGPQLVRLAMGQSGVSVDGSAWQAIGMAGSGSVDLVFSGAVGDVVGVPGDYLSRPGFWHGGAGIAACWYGGAVALGAALRRSAAGTSDANRSVFKTVALGRIDVSLQTTAALLRDAARWIDAHPADDASAVALRARLATEQCAKTLLDEAGRALGAAAYCRDPHFARMAADLPVFVRQSHAERDFAALGERMAALERRPPDCPWAL